MLKSMLMQIYAFPELFPNLYSVCKALENLESSLLGGLYHNHFLRATNVIGSTARGTFNRPVEALKLTFSKKCFPVLDDIKGELGSTMDQVLVNNEGRILQTIENAHFPEKRTLKSSWLQPDEGSVVASVVSRKYIKHLNCDIPWEYLDHLIGIEDGFSSLRSVGGV